MSCHDLSRTFSDVSYVALPGQSQGEESLVERQSSASSAIFVCLEAVDELLEAASGFPRSGVPWGSVSATIVSAHADANDSLL